MNWQIFKELCYSRRNVIVFYAQYPILVFCAGWAAWCVLYAPKTKFDSWESSLCLILLGLSVLYIALAPLILREKWRMSHFRYYQYELWLTDLAISEFYLWAKQMQFKDGEWKHDRGDWNGNSAGNKWRSQILFERSDYWMEAKLRFT